MIKQLYRFLNPKFQNLFLEYKVAFKPRYGHGKPAHADLLEIINSKRNIYIYTEQGISVKRKYLDNQGFAV